MKNGYILEPQEEPQNVKEKIYPTQKIVTQQSGSLATQIFSPRVSKAICRSADVSNIRKWPDLISAKWEMGVTSVGPEQIIRASSTIKIFRDD